MLIKRYLYREVSHTFFAVILVILLIAISNKLVRLVAQAAIGNIPPNVLFEVILFQVPDLLAFLLPIGLFLAILLCFSRFFAENEIPVMLACGISWRKLLAVTLSLGVVVMLLAASLTCYFAPKSAQYREQLLHTDGPMLLIQTLAPGRFHSFQKDKLVFYVSELSNDRKTLNRVFIAEQPNNSEQKSWSLISAQAGKIFTDKQGSTYFTMLNGKRYQGSPGQMDYNVVHFDEYQRLLENPKMQEGLFFHRTMPTKMLLDDPTRSNLAELQWRLSIPLAAPLLALLALPLSRVGPRQGRFSRLFVAIVICIVYFNLLTVSKRWVASGMLAPNIGVWWVHTLMLIFGLLFLAKASGRANQSYQWLRQKFS